MLGKDSAGPGSGVPFIFQDAIVCVLHANHSFAGRDGSPFTKL